MIQRIRKGGNCTCTATWGRPFSALITRPMPSSQTVDLSVPDWLIAFYCW